MSLDTLLPLELLRPGAWGEVCDVAGDPHWVARLAELGLRAGSRIQLVQCGPPCLVSIGGMRLSLRCGDAVHVFVRPLEES